MNFYWYELGGFSTRVCVLTNRKYKYGDYIELRDCQGRIERRKDGSWNCIVKVDGHMKPAANEPSARLAKERVYRDFLRFLSEGRKCGKQ